MFPTSKNSHALKAVEEEFGHLRRQLERRERARLGLASPLTPPNGGSFSESSNGEDFSNCSPISADQLCLENSVRSTLEHQADIMLPASSSIECVRTAQKRHNRLLVQHSVQWAEGKQKIRTMFEKDEEFRQDLLHTIEEAKEVHTMNPPTIDSSVSSNYLPIREQLRGIASLGGDEDIKSTNDFDFLQSDADLTTREKILLQRVKDLTTKVKNLQAENACVEEKLRTTIGDYEAKLHDLREEHAETMAEKEEEWRAEKECLESDLNHWKGNSTQLQQMLTDARALTEREREGHRQAMEATAKENSIEIAKWTQAVSLLERERHATNAKVKEYEALLSNATELQRNTDEQLRTLQLSHKELQATYASVHADCERTRESLLFAEAQVSRLMEVKPQLKSMEIQVDTDALIYDMKMSLEDFRKESVKQKQEIESTKKKLVATTTEVSNAELLRKQFNTLQVQVKETQGRLDEKERLLKRVMKRRMEVVCENFVLRTQLRLLQRPNGFGERMEELTRENRWLMHKLDKITPMRLRSSSTQEAFLNDAECGAQRPATMGPFIVDKLEDETFKPHERVDLTHIADACTQTAAMPRMTYSEQVSAGYAAYDEGESLIQSPTNEFITAKKSSKFAVSSSAHLRSSNTQVDHDDAALIEPFRFSPISRQPLIAPYDGADTASGTSLHAVAEVFRAAEVGRQLTATSPGLRLMWKCASTQVTPLILENDIDEVAVRATLSRYMRGSDGLKELQQTIGSDTNRSADALLASLRFKKSPISAETRENGEYGRTSNKMPSFGYAVASDAFQPQSGKEAQISRTGTYGKLQNSLSSSEASPKREGTQPCDEGTQEEQDLPQSRPSMASRPLSASHVPKPATVEFCVLGKHDTPQNSALSGNPSKYYSMKRSSGLGGLEGMRKEQRLQLYTQETSVMVTAPLNAEDPAEAVAPVRGVGSQQWAATNYAVGTTFAVRTLQATTAPKRASSASGVRPGGEQRPAQVNRPSSALQHDNSSQQPIHNIGSYMPANKGPGGAWRTKGLA